MEPTYVNVEKLRPGQFLWDWTRQAREKQGMFASVQEGPDGCWQAMVVSNQKADEGPSYFGDAPLRLVHVLFWNDAGDPRLNSFFWVVGSTTRVI